MAITELNVPKNITFVVEKIRLVGYTGFWMVVLMGIFLTKAFGEVDLQSTVLMEVFGYNNICVYFDHPPSTFILPWLWAVTLVLLLSYITAHWLQMRAEVQESVLDIKTYRLLSGLKLFEAFTMIAFSTSFAVHPDAWDHTLYIHTVPFFLLQIGLVSLAMSNTLHGIKSGYWKRLDLPTWFETAAKVYVVLFTLVVCFKIPAATNAMADSIWWEQTATFISTARIFDLLFMLFAAIIPMVKAAYFVWIRGDKLAVVHLATRTSNYHVR